MESVSVGSVSISEQLRRITEHWSPKTVATVNTYDIRLAKVQGGFVRHRHVESDECFLVVEGELTIRMDDGDVTLGPGELCVVPRGVYHQPFSAGETSILLFEPSEIVNTGDAGGDLTAPRTTI
ncbi:MAG: cupin domain-containing protein [Dactylosporangium sp.]|nr:cupin domain-containing protein [Dactylosporangium sp.]NNJ63086.1 cupin domain-containing protein [Dactylosporangium sp.]